MPIAENPGASNPDDDNAGDHPYSIPISEQTVEVVTENATPLLEELENTPASHGEGHAAATSTSKKRFQPSKSSTVGSRKKEADALLARKDGLQELLVEEVTKHTNPDSGLDTSAEGNDADAENTDNTDSDKTLPLDLSTSGEGSLVGKEPPNIPLDLTKYTEQEKQQLVTEEEDGAYLHLTIPSIKLGDGLVIGSVTMNSNLGELKTKDLRAESKRLRRELDKTAERFREAHNECTRLRDVYYYSAVKHAEIAHHISIRETLKITGKLNRPLTSKEKDLIEGVNLRSGKKLKLKQGETQDEIEDRIFQFDAHAMMRDFRHNIKHVTHQKGHSKERICVMQTYTEKCAICCKTFRTADGLKSHLTAHTMMFYRCPLCVQRDGSDRQYRSLKAFKHHLKWHSLSEPLYVCPECGVEKEWQKNLDSHMTTHRPADKPCRVHKNCIALFSFDNERNHHERHSDAKQIYECDHCRSKFKSYLKKELHDARYHTPGSKHYISGTAATASGGDNTDSSSNKAPRKPTKQQIRNKHKQKILAPLLADLSTDSPHNTTLDTTTSDYVPSARELAEAEQSDLSDFLPDVQ